MSVLAPVIVTGNTAVVVSSTSRPLPAITLAEVLATSDVPGGVVNMLTGDAAELGPWLAAHMDVNAIDLAGVAGDDDAATALEEAAADNLKRVAARRLPSRTGPSAPGTGHDDRLRRDQDRLAPDRRVERPIGLADLRP